MTPLLRLPRLLSFAALLLTGCVAPYTSVEPGPHGPVAVTHQQSTGYGRVRTEKHLVVPADFHDQLALYRRRHGFFPLSVAGLAAESDSARAAVAALFAAGFAEPDLVRGGGPDSVRLVFTFTTTGRRTRVVSSQSADFISVNRTFREPYPVQPEGEIPGAFVFRYAPADGRVTATRHLGRYRGWPRWLAKLGIG